MTIFQRWLNSKPSSSLPNYSRGMQSIYRKLEQFRKDHSLIYVALADQENEWHQSLILDVDIEANTISIDELFPGNITLFQGQLMNVSLKKDDNQTLAFQSKLLLENADQSYRSYTLALPEYIENHQRRSAYRLATQGKIRWDDSDSTCSEGKILDLSATGVRIQLDHPADELSSGDHLTNCQLNVPSLSLQCDVEVTRLSEDNKYLVGGRLTDLEPPQQRSLEQYLVQAQRHQRHSYR